MCAYICMCVLICVVLSVIVGVCSMQKLGVLYANVGMCCMQLLGVLYANIILLFVLCDNEYITTEMRDNFFSIPSLWKHCFPVCVCICGCMCMYMYFFYCSSAPCLDTLHVVRSPHLAVAEMFAIMCSAALDSFFNFFF